MRGGDWFNETPMKGQRDRYKKQVSDAISQAKAKGRFIIILELGAGFNTPGFVRFPLEKLVEQYGGLVKLVRVNLQYPDVPSKVNAVGVKAGAVEFLAALGTAKETH